MNIKLGKSRPRPESCCFYIYSCICLPAMNDLGDDATIAHSHWDIATPTVSKSQNLRYHHSKHLCL